MRMVVISYPDGHQEESLLADVPSVGHRLRLAAAGTGDPLLVVESVTWVEATVRHPDPSVVINVKPEPK